jgi:SAM-dependent methyltransferase
MRSTVSKVLVAAASKPCLRQSHFASKVLQKKLLVPTPPEILDIFSSTANTSDDEEPLLILKVARWINDYLLKQMPSMTGEAVYTESVLEDYDTLVWDFNSPFHWRIQPQDIQTLYNDCLSQSVRHCEVAVGTGLFLKGLQSTEGSCSPLNYLTLVDLNPNSLKSCQKRLSGVDSYCSVQIELVRQDILSQGFSSPLLVEASYDSVAANFLFHCLHENDDRVATLRLAIQNMARLLKPDTGVFFGSTILGKELLDGDEVTVGAAALETLHLYNKFGLFGNEKDSFQLISQVLHEIFDDVEIWQVGYCAVWKARKPKKTPP